MADSEEAPPKPTKEYEADHATQKLFSPQEWSEQQRLFGNFDAEFSGSIKKSDVPEMLKALGHRDFTEAKTANLLKSSTDAEGETLTFDTYIKLFADFQISSGNKELKGTIKQVAGHQSGSHHSYSVEEAAYFSEYINHHLGADEDLSHLLPINPQSDDIFDACANGVLLCKLINIATPGTIYAQAINVKKNLSIFQIKENLNQALNAAKSIGCVVVSITAESVIEKKEHLVLALLWQIVKIHILSAVDLKQHPELVLLVEEDEELADLLKLPPEQLLLRWVNYHLKNANVQKRIKNFGEDVKDSEAYTYLLNQISSESCPLSPLQEEDNTARAAKVIENANRLEVTTFVRPADIAAGNPKLNLLFAAAIFNTNPGLVASEQELYEAAQLLNDDVEGTREERSFRMWMNSLNIDDLYVNNLYEDVRDGMFILKALDRTSPGSVNWNQIEKNATNKFKKMANCNKVIEIGRNLRFTLVNISGNDILDANKKLILAYMWQLIRHAILEVIGSMTEDQLVEWANGRVGKPPGIANLRDPSMKNSKYLIDLFCTVESRVVNWELFQEGEEEEALENNAKYLMAIIRKLGCPVFCTWNDIVEVNPKMILTIIASANGLSKTYNKKKMEAVSETPEEESKEESKE